MERSKPNRDGWMTGVLAEVAASPPFPAFTEFERSALDGIAPLFGKNESAFREQVANAEVTDRINTVAGFYTRVKVDREKCSPLQLSGHGAHFDVEGVEHGVGIELWDTNGDGYLETIEGWTTDEKPFEGVDLAALKFVRLV
jgi:hypothetical protein